MPPAIALASASMRGGEGAKGTARRPDRVLAARRRRAAVLLLALAYTAAILVLLLGAGGTGLGTGGGRVVVGAPRPRARAPALPGSVYRSHLVFERLLPEMRALASRPGPVSSCSFPGT
ncbi:hypothetical protein ACQJBY_031930 [Aegilops geniculata]